MVDEHLITKELIEEAETAFTSHFKPAVSFEHSLSFSLQSGKQEEEDPETGIRRPARSLAPIKRSPQSLVAESLICKQLGWDMIFDNPGTYPFDEIMDVIRQVNLASEKGSWVSLGPLTTTDVDIISPFVKGINAQLETVNKDLQKKLIPRTTLASLVTMLSEARKIQRGVSINLGLGEKLDDLQNLFQFIETHNITRVSFASVRIEKETRFSRAPSSFYCARWIAETRIRFPRIAIVASTSDRRVAETGLFVKAGANIITGFPAMKLFNSEQAKILEEEIKNAGRAFKGTLTNMNLLNTIQQATGDDGIKEKLEKCIAGMKKTQQK